MSDENSAASLGLSLEDAGEAFREALLNLEGIEEEIAVVKQRLNEWLQRFATSR